MSKPKSLLFITGGVDSGLVSSIDTKHNVQNTKENSHNLARSNGAISLHEGRNIRQRRFLKKRPTRFGRFSWHFPRNAVLLNEFVDRAILIEWIGVADNILLWRGRYLPRLFVVFNKMLCSRTSKQGIGRARFFVPRGRQTLLLWHQRWGRERRGMQGARIGLIFILGIGKAGTLFVVENSGIVII